ncbi:MAG: ATP synthase F1 subunit epsilon [Deltaproteobacteria bacterium]|nr:ATP synthase F1 subunit epsilon [Deltaproteobacteria bacterium]
MKNTSFHLKLITRDRTLIDGDYAFAVIPSGAGPLGVLPGHTSLMGTLNAGLLVLRDSEKKETPVFVDRGFFMIANDAITVTARVAELAAVIDVDRATAARDRARQRLNSKDSAFDMFRARSALNRAEARLKVAQSMN